jgi:[phosphatase 2A protein]-leucine-carboxy methyltransferase
MGDAAIRDTDNDAAVSRLSAVNAGYLDDPFAQYFVKRSQSRPPLINIGTFLRTWAIDELVNQFLDAPTIPKDQNGLHKKQILSVGAGTDTRFFRIRQVGGRRAASLHRYVEVDFPEATTKKAMTIKKRSALANLLTYVRLGEDDPAYDCWRISLNVQSLSQSKVALA